MMRITLLSTLLIAFINGRSQNNCPNFCFTPSQTNVCKGSSMTFTHNSSNPNVNFIVWDFGDGAPTYTMTVPTSTVTHTYTATGNYNPYITLYDITSNYLGYSYGSSGNIQVNGLTGINSPDSVCPGETNNFCLNSNGPVNSSTWKFGNGGTASENNSCTNYAYPSQGTYTLTGYASANGCPVDSFKKAIIAHPNTSPNTSWWYNGNSPFCPNQNIWFNTNPASSYTWNFGDGGVAFNMSPSHSYTAAGTYSVTLTKMNVCGKTKSYTQTVQVFNNVHFPNQSWFKIDGFNSPVCPNSNVSFNAPGGYDDYEWNFGDGSPAETTSDNWKEHGYGPALTTYTVSCKITNGCSNDTTLYAVVQVTSNAPFPNQSWFALQANSPICPGQGAQFNAPNGYVNYAWNYGDGSPIVNNNDSWSNHVYGTTLTTYTASVKITNGCNNDTTIYTTVSVQSNVGFPNNSWFKIETYGPYCVSDPAFFNSPNGYSNYLWNFGDGHSANTSQGYANHTYTATGTYTVSLQITNGCNEDTTLYATIIINNTGVFPTWMDLDAFPNSGSCPGDIVSFEVQSGNNFSNFEWNFGDGGTLNSNSNRVQHTYTAVGTYTVSCKVTNGCGQFTMLYKLVNVINNAPVSSVQFVQFQEISCPGDNVNFIPSNGQASYTYYWNFGDGTLDTTAGAGAVHAFASAGNYTINVTAINGCGSTKTVTSTHSVSLSAPITLNSPSGEPQWGYPGGEGGGNDFAGCAGDAIIFYFMGEAAYNLWDFGDGNTGTAVDQMVVFGGDGGAYPVTYIQHSYAANGTYSISLTVQNGCGNSLTENMTIQIGGNLQVNGELTSSPPPYSTCAPIDFIAFGGETYNFDFGDGNNINTTSPTVSHTYASAGQYIVSVLITNGCGNAATYTMPLQVDSAGGAALALDSLRNPSCVGNADGYAAVNVISGNQPYTYQWNDVNGQTTSAASSLSAGWYNVVVTDGIGCISNLNVNVVDPAAMTFTSSVTNSNCGSADGAATVAVTGGGSAPYSYSWSSGQTTSAAQGLAAGMYYVTVTDTKGCAGIEYIGISENGGASVSLNTANQVSCNGLSNGSINIDVTGGSPPYTYLWSNGATTEDVTGLAAGTHSVQVTSAGGCVAMYSETITEPDAILTGMQVDIAPTCGNFNGIASANPQGGNSPYTYLWTNAGNQTTQTATGLPAGNFSVTITDASGCTVIGVIGLSNSNAPQISETVTNVGCFGGANGSIDLTVTGGTSPYLYTWNVGPPQTNNQDINNLAAGTYFVSVNDAKGCQSFRIYQVTQPAALTASVTVMGATCNQNDGSATALPSGGTTPYTYLWNSVPSQTTQAAGNLALGNYTATITDSKGCNTSATATITATTLPIDICEVTVDSGSTHNIVVWDKPNVTNIDSFFVYRLVGLNYVKIGAVDFSAPSMYKDSTVGVNPNVTSYRYKIAAKDNCGGVSAMSPHHKTMHLTANIGIGGVVNLIWTNYEGFQNAYYRIWRDSTGINPELKDSVPFGNTTWTDLNPPTILDTVRYYIEIKSPGGCQASIKNPEPMATNLNSSKSNIYRISDTTVTGLSVNMSEMVILLYPNPNQGQFTVEVNEHESLVQMVVMNMLGDVILHTGIPTGIYRKQVDLNHLPQGVYTVRFQYGYQTIIKKVIIE